MLVTSKKHVHSTHASSMMDNAHISFKQSIMNCSIALNSDLTMHDYVTQLLKHASTNLAIIDQFAYLCKIITDALISAFIQPKINYCNSLLFGNYDVLVTYVFQKFVCFTNIICHIYVAQKTTMLLQHPFKCKQRASSQTTCRH